VEQTVWKTPALFSGFRINNLEAPRFRNRRKSCRTFHVEHCNAN